MALLYLGKTATKNAQEPHIERDVLRPVVERLLRGDENIVDQIVRRQLANRDYISEFHDSQFPMRMIANGGKKGL